MDRVKSQLLLFTKASTSPVDRRPRSEGLRVSQSIIEVSDALWRDRTAV
jgi:hypothetical protein